MAPSVLAVNPSVPAHSIADLIRIAKAAPGQMHYGSPGIGTTNHLAGELLASMAGLKITHIPYKGTGPAITDLLGGHISMMFAPIPAAHGNVSAGALRALGVTSLKRSNLWPDIPTIAEAGLPGYESYTWFGLFGPKGLDADIVNKVNAAVKAALETPAVQKRLLELGNTPRWESPEQFRQTVKADRQKWAAVVKEVGATID
jgi:tripartite-type tricarboxylate transporter receptor subunit TctC